MALVNVFIKAWNDNRQVTLGGRRATDSAGVWLNTAHQNGTTGMTMSAEVTGPGLSSRERRKKGSDQREAHFTVELPEPDKAVHVRIVQHGEKLRQLAAMGSILCIAKGIEERISNPEHSEECVKFGVETLGELTEEIGRNLPNVELPGGVSLAHALACVKIVEQIKAGLPHN